MFKFFKKKSDPTLHETKNFEIELTGTILAYEVARSDGNISKTEIDILLSEIEKIALKVGKPKYKILKIVEEFSKKSVSFHEFIEDINKTYSKKNKLSLLQFLYNVAYADNILEINEERLIRRIADLIKIKDIEVLKIKDISKTKE